MIKQAVLLSIAIFASHFAEANVTDKLEYLPQEDHFEQVQDEISRIDMLIKATEENLVREKKLKSLISEYRKVEETCIQNPKDTDLLFKLAKTGNDVYECIQESSLGDYFQPEFIKELQRLAQISNKKTIPPVQ